MIREKEEKTESIKAKIEKIKLMSIANASKGSMSFSELRLEVLDATFERSFLGDKTSLFRFQDGSTQQQSGVHFFQFGNSSLKSLHLEYLSQS